jgi:hypothetical protein
VLILLKTFLKMLLLSRLKLLEVEEVIEVEEAVEVEEVVEVVEVEEEQRSTTLKMLKRAILDNEVCKFARLFVCFLVHNSH